jgi:sugar phosphate isomerase/epimerase
MKLSLTTVAVPNLSLQEIVAFAARLGYDGIELRVRRTPEAARGQPYSYWGAHKADITPDDFVAKAPMIARVFADHGLKMPALASNETALELDDVARLAEGAAICGCPLVRIGAPRRYDGAVSYHELYSEAVDALGRALEVTSAHGVRGLLEIHGGTIAISASLAFRLVSNFTSEQIGVIYDVQNMVREGFEGYRLGLDLLGQYLAHVHIGGHRPMPSPRRPDGTVRWLWEACSIADGLLDAGNLISELRRSGYSGFLTVEDFRTEEAEAKFSEAASYLRPLLLSSTQNP